MPHSASHEPPSHETHHRVPHTICPSSFSGYKKIVITQIFLISVSTRCSVSYVLQHRSSALESSSLLVDSSFSPRHGCVALPLPASALADPPSQDVDFTPSTSGSIMPRSFPFHRVSGSLPSASPLCLRFCFLMYFVSVASCISSLFPQVSCLNFLSSVSVSSSFSFLFFFSFPPTLCIPNRGLSPHPPVRCETSQCRVK